MILKIKWADGRVEYRDTGNDSIIFSGNVTNHRLDIVKRKIVDGGFEQIDYDTFFNDGRIDKLELISDAGFLLHEESLLHKRQGWYKFDAKE